MYDDASLSSVRPSSASVQNEMNAWIEWNRRRRFATVTVATMLVALLALAPIWSGGSYSLTRYGIAIAYVATAIGLNLALGYAGQLVLGHTVILASSAYVAGMLSVHLGWGFVVVFPLALVAGIGVGLLMMVAGLRVQGWYLALITLFAVMVLPKVVILAEPWTGGEFGLTGVRIPDFLGSPLGDVAIYELTVLWLAVVWLLSGNVVRSGWGLRWKALRIAPRAAQSVGMNLNSARFLAYLVSAIPAAGSGVLLAYMERFVNADAYGVNLTLLLLTGVVLGGAGTFWGPVVGMAPLLFLSFWVGPFSPYNTIVLGFGLLIGSVAFANGLVPALSRVLNRKRSASSFSQEGSTVRRRSPAAETASRRPSSSVTTDSVVLDAHGITKAFGGVVALDNVGLQLRQGTLLGLVGPNGSGKSTFLNVLSGIVSPDAGHVRICGQDVTGWAPHDIARVGIGRTFQVPQLIGELSVIENIELGLVGSERGLLVKTLLRTRSTRHLESVRRERARDTFIEVGLPPSVLAAPAANLPLGLQRIVEIGRAIVRAPTLLVLDEPAAGLNDEERNELGLLLRQLRDDGMTIVVVEHNVPFVLRYCDELMLLEGGGVSCRAVLDGQPLPERLVAYLNHSPQ